jgi:hypothetical protein
MVKVTAVLSLAGGVERPSYCSTFAGSWVRRRWICA